jgi:hypothetical protein
VRLLQWDRYRGAVGNPATETLMLQSDLAVAVFECVRRAKPETFNALVRWSSGTARR